MSSPDPPRMSPLSVLPWHRTLASTEAHDKLLRLLQYLCKLLRGLDFGRITPPPKTSAATVHSLETALATSRQIWRLFKWMSVYANTQGLPSSFPVAQVVRVVNDAAMFCYYLCDNVTFLHKVGIVNGDVKAAARRAARFWFVGVLVKLLGSVHELARVLVEERELVRVVEREKDEGKMAELGGVRRRKRALLMGCFKFGNDCVVAGSLSGIGNEVHPGIVGGCGVLSSAVGIWQTWPTHVPR